MAFGWICSTRRREEAVDEGDLARIRWVVVKANTVANLERLGLFGGHTSSLSVTGRDAMYEEPFPILGQSRLENGAKSDCCPATQSISNPVSSRCLPETGIFQIYAGDYRLFRSRNGRFRSPETDSQFPKARHWRVFLRLLRVKCPSAGLVGWGGRIRTSVWWNQNQATSPTISKRILKKVWNSALKVSIG
jgi:hypothetical protein